MVWWASKYRDVTLGDQPALRDELTADIGTSKKIEFWDLKGDEICEVAHRPDIVDYATFCRALYARHAQKASKPQAILGDKNNFHINNVPLIDALQPGSKFIHIVRDGRDVAASYLALNQASQTTSSPYYPKLAGTVGQAADEWANNVMQARQSLALLPHARWIEVRYEDIVRSTVSTMERVCAFLGVAFDPQMLNYHEQNRRHNLEPKEFGAWKQRTFQAIDDSAIGRHRELGAAAISKFNDIANEPLSIYGYI